MTSVWTVVSAQDCRKTCLESAVSGCDRRVVRIDDAREECRTEDGIPLMIKQQEAGQFPIFVAVEVSREPLPAGGLRASGAGIALGGFGESNSDR